MTTESRQDDRKWKEHFTRRLNSTGENSRLLPGSEKDRTGTLEGLIVSRRVSSLEKLSLKACQSLVRSSAILG